MNSEHNSSRKLSFPFLFDIQQNRLRFWGWDGDLDFEGEVDLGIWEEEKPVEIK